MKHFYVVPSGFLAATPPVGVWHAMPCPGAPQTSVVVVELWRESALQDAWEELPEVTELHPETLGGLAPPTAIAAFAPWGAVTGMTWRGLFGLIRRQWPAWRA